VRNALERARLRQANRLVDGDKKELTKQDLMRIEGDDIRKSRVFSDEQGREGEPPDDDSDEDADVPKGQGEDAEENGQGGDSADSDESEE
jgi:hypothetical protein